MLQVFFDLNETEKVPDEQVQDYFRLWIHHCIKIKENVEARKSQEAQVQSQRQLTARPDGPGHGGQLATGQSVAIQQLPNQNFAMAARAMVNGQAPSTIPIGRLYPHEHPSQYGHQNTGPPKPGPVGPNPPPIQRFPQPVKNISPAKMAGVSKKRPSEEESDQEAKMIKHEAPDEVQIVQILPPTQNKPPTQPESKIIQQPYSLSKENTSINALSIAAANQIRRGFVQSDIRSQIPSLPKTFSHFQNPSPVNLQRAFSQVTQQSLPIQTMKAVQTTKTTGNDIFDNAHRSAAINSIAQQSGSTGAENRIFLHEKITLLQSTNDILTSGKYFHNSKPVLSGQVHEKEKIVKIPKELKVRDAVIETQRLKMNQMAFQIQLLSRRKMSN